jgi:hypothetical protein
MGEKIMLCRTDDGDVIRRPVAYRETGMLHPELRPGETLYRAPGDTMPTIVSLVRQDPAQ